MSDDTTERLMRAAIEVAQRARDHGNHPFGALLVDQDNNILLTAENTVVTENDCTGHAETNLMRLASQKYDPDFLAMCTLYTSAEPCRDVFAKGHKQIEVIGPVLEEEAFNVHQGFWTS